MFRRRLHHLIENLPAKRIDIDPCVGWQIGGKCSLLSYRPRSLNPGCSSGRLPSGQKNLRSDSSMGRSLMLA
jgi:hypothetical protein